MSGPRIDSVAVVAGGTGNAGEAVGAFVAHILTDGMAHGTTVHMESMEQLDEIGESL